MFKLLIKLTFVFILGAGELWVAIPAGIAIKLHPWMVALTSASGAALGSLTVIFLGARLRAWLLKEKEPQDNPNGFIFKIWQRYGIIGLGLLAPLVTGAPLGAALGISMGAEPRKLLGWMVIGILLWTVILTLSAWLGFKMVKL